MHIDHSHNIVEVKDVSFSYGNKEVLSHINLNIHKGDYLGVIGPNGSGKTTLLKIILGLIKPIHGRVYLFGKEVTHFKEWSKIGYVGQKAVNFDNNFPITVREVVAMGRIGPRGLFQWLNKKDKAIVKKSLQHVGMWDYKDRIIGDLSGGQQQRVFIARALATEPEVIFLDEPTAGVDAKAQEDFYTLLRKLNKALEVTLVLISHDLQVVARETTELACINKTLIYESNPKHFISHGGLKKVYGDHVTHITHAH